MRPAQLRSFLAATIPTGNAVMVTGEPGIGKTEIIDQSRLDADADLILSHPSVSDPTDVKGLPWMVTTDGTPRATFLPFGELARAMRATKRTVWFFDDLGQAPPAMQAACMQLFLARRVNEHIVPDCVTFMAATNRRTDKAGVSGILEPVKSRFVSIVELKTNIDDWSMWAIDHNLPPELIGFLRFRPDLLSKFEASADMTNSPTPRTWHHAAKLLALTLPDDVMHEAIAGAVGAAAAGEFTAFRRMYRTLPDIDGILKNPDASRIPDDPSALYAIATALAMKATVDNFAKVARYAERLTKENHGEFATLMIRDAVRHDKAIMNSAVFVRLAAGGLGTLIAGGI